MTGLQSYCRLHVVADAMAVRSKGLPGQASSLVSGEHTKMDTCILQVLNAINKGSTATTDKQKNIRFQVHDPSKPQKVKERLATGAEKVFVLVSVMLRQQYPCSRPGKNKIPCVCFRPGKVRQPLCLHHAKGLPHPVSMLLQINQGLADQAADTLDYCMKQEMSQVWPLYTGVCGMVFKGWFWRRAICLLGH